MIKTFHISDLFITAWHKPDKTPALSVKDMLQVITLREQMKMATAKGLHASAGYFGIKLLQILRKDKKNVSKINVMQAVDCVNDLAFIHQPWYFFPVPAFTIGDVTFTPPCEKMEDRCFEQLVYADSAFSQYCITDYKDRHAIPSMDPSTRADAHIEDLIATLYQLPENFSDKTVDEYAKLIAKKLTAVDKALILHTYANIREYIVETHRDLFPKGEEEQLEEERFPVYTGKQWVDLLYDLAESPVFPSLEKASKAEIYKALYWLNKKCAEKPNQPQHAQS